MIKTILLENEIFSSVKYLFNRLLAYPILIVWIVAGSIISVIDEGDKGLIKTAANLMLLMVYTIVIKMMTDKTPKRRQELYHPKLELILGIILYVIVSFATWILWHQIKVPYVSNYINDFILNLKKNIYLLRHMGVPVWELDLLFNAIVTISIELIPVLILFLSFGYGFKKMGFAFKNVHLLLVLVTMTIVLGLPLGILSAQPFYKTAITFFISIFINGLPEELIFRGYLLPRVEALLDDSIYALIIVALAFNAIHIPSYLANGVSLQKILLITFSISHQNGLIWGYLFLRTRSIVPGAIWHASNEILGIIFTTM